MLPLSRRCARRWWFRALAADILVALACTPFAARPALAVDPAVLAAENERIEAMDRASRAAVAVFAKNGQGGGSGVVISPDGYAVTNFHVARPAGNVMKCGMSDGQMVDAVIVGIDPTGDIALIKLVGRDDFPTVELADSDQVRSGDWCFAVGNPFLLATDLTPTVTWGVVSGVHRYQYPEGTLLEYADCLQVDAAINPGNSGGPLFDATGRLIGINGRISLEKRGRVNVGVGYAVSINQVKNFLGQLKSGRLVDHATLGAKVSHDADRRVVIDDILEESDAFRRGLRYGDEIVSFAGRPIGSVNAMKNSIGIFPKGWRVPLVYRRDGEAHTAMVRLAGLHREAELAKLLGQGDPDAGEPKPGQPPRRGPERPRRPRRPPSPDRQPFPFPLPEALKKLFEPGQNDLVRQHLVERTGYVNYYFNQFHRDRLWKSFAAGSDFAALGGAWTIHGEPAEGGELRISLTDDAAAIVLPGGELKVDLTANLAEYLSQAKTAEMLVVSLGLWRRMLVGGPEKFGEVTYFGSTPSPIGPWSAENLAEVLVGTYRGAECRFLFDPNDARLLGLELWTDDDEDPCELTFTEYGEALGRPAPTRIEVRHGDAVYQVLALRQYELAATPSASLPQSKLPLPGGTPPEGQNNPTGGP